MSSENSVRCVEAAKLMNQAVELLLNSNATVAPQSAASAQTQSTPLPHQESVSTDVARPSASQELRDALPLIADPLTNLTGLEGEEVERVANTWTHKFCLVPYKDLQFTPSLREKDSWKAAGLGEKVVSFRKNGDYKSFEETLCNAYEALNDAGGFLLHRSSRNGSGENRRLELIPIPYGGYTARYLKFDSPLRSATCYIRPMQKDLSLSVIVPIQSSPANSGVSTAVRQDYVNKPGCFSDPFSFRMKVYSARPYLQRKSL
eukprot:Seg5489.2 transcript_id=Seg5489.2/GoldUCD/mRNA.D3Y31 product="hypothetical protein" protein_id=Seg5489.2/GoldUCD/D3Y31